MFMTVHATSLSLGAGLLLQNASHAWSAALRFSHMSPPAKASSASSPSMWCRQYSSTSRSCEISFWPQCAEGRAQAIHRRAALDVELQELQHRVVRAGGACLEAGEHIPVIPASLLDLAQDGWRDGIVEDGSPREPVLCPPTASPSASSPDRPSLHLREQNSSENRGGQEDVGLKLVLHDLAGDDPARPRFRSSCDHCI